MLRSWLLVALLLSLSVAAAPPRSTPTRDGSAPEWANDMTAVEAEWLMQEILSMTGLKVQEITHVLREDLDGDGRTDYVLAPSARAGQRGMPALLAVLRRGERSEVVRADQPAGDSGLPHRRELRALDIDGDGRKDVVDQHHFFIGGGEPSAHAKVWRNTSSGFQLAYARDSFAAVHFDDRDGDGLPELLDFTNEARLDHANALWPVLYRWKVDRFVDSSSEFPDLYADRIERFTELLKYAEEQNADYRSKTGRDNDYYLTMISTMREYIKRAKQISEGSSR